MKYIKCLSKGYRTFTYGKIYPVIREQKYPKEPLLKQKLIDDRSTYTSYCIKNDHNCYINVILYGFEIYIPRHLKLKRILEND
jgi:hypothetical protein